jgi:hypothetical protein
MKILAYSKWDAVAVLPNVRHAVVPPRLVNWCWRSRRLALARIRPKSHTDDDRKLVRSCKYFPPLAAGPPRVLVAAVEQCDAPIMGMFTDDLKLV